MRAHGSIHAPRRWLLPLLAIVAVALVARWLSWPGLATHDTVWSTREAVLGRYTTYHPLLNALLLRALAVPFESYAVYTSLQIVLCAALFFRSLRLVAGDAEQMWPVWLGISIWGLSLHTVLFLGLVWKDVPIAYGLCFIAALAFAVRRNPAMQVRRIDALLLGVSVFLCVGLRHGMAFNLVLVPLLLGAGRGVEHAELHRHPDEQPRGDLGVGQAVRDERGDLGLPFGQLIQRLGHLAVGQPGRVVPR